MCVLCARCNFEALKSDTVESRAKDDMFSSEHADTYEALVVGAPRFDTDVT